MLDKIRNKRGLRPTLAITGAASRSLTSSLASTPVIAYKFRVSYKLEACAP